MKIAVPTRDGHIDDHFGHCAYYTIFDEFDTEQPCCCCFGNINFEEYDHPTEKGGVEE